MGAASLYQSPHPHRLRRRRTFSHTYRGGAERSYSDAPGGISRSQNLSVLSPFSDSVTTGGTELTYCPGTTGIPCRSGRGGGPARVVSDGPCGNCRRRKTRHRSTATGNAAAAASDASRRDRSALAAAYSTLRAQQSASPRITYEVLRLVSELVDHLDTNADLPSSDILRAWYDPPGGDLPHADRRARRHAAALLTETLIKSRAIPASDMDTIVGPPVRRPDGVGAQQQAPRRSRTTIEQAQQVWAAAVPASSSPVERWIKETRRALPVSTAEMPWALRMILPQQLRDMNESLQRPQEFPDTTDCIAVWAHQDSEGIIRCVSLDSLHTTETGVAATEPRWRPDIGEHADSAIFVSPAGEPMIPDNTETVYLVEGPVDALAVSTHHQTTAVACGGTGRPAEVAEIIHGLCPHADIICIADGDTPGRKTMRQAAQQVPHITQVIEMPDGIDPGEYFAQVRGGSG